MLMSVLVLFHLLGFAAFVGGALAQQHFMRGSGKAGLVAAVRDEYERLAAAVCTKVELTGLFAQVLTGVAIVAVLPGFLTQHWLHAKLTAVLVLLVLAHVEMIGARRIVKARQAGGEGAEGDITARKKRHATVGIAVDVLIVAVLLLASVLRTGF
jgi:uncharacterized membrane protein